MNGTVLYVEDEEDFQMLVTRLLLKEGVSVDIANSKEEALVSLQRNRPDLIILDVNLPDGNGYDLCTQIREDKSYSAIPILMLTVRRRPDEWLRGFASGADDYVSKPLNPPELLERIEYGLESKIRVVPPAAKPEYLLIQAALAGNRNAFAVLIAQHKKNLILGLMRDRVTEQEAEDIVSHAFYQAYERLNQFRGQSSFFTWIFSIALHELSHRRRRSHVMSLDELSEKPESMPFTEDSHDDTLEPNSQIVKTAMSRLPYDFQNILDLSVQKELTYEQIAEILHIPTGTVMSRLFKARRLLRESWDEILKGEHKRVADK